MLNYLDNGTLHARKRQFLLMYIGLLALVADGTLQGKTSLPQLLSLAI